MDIDYSTRILEASDAPQLKQLQLEAVELHPDAFWKTLEEERQVTDQEWAERANARTENDDLHLIHCVVGLFHKSDLVGKMEFLYQPERGSDVMVMGRLYIRKEHHGEDHAHVIQLFNAGMEWVRDLKTFTSIITAARDDNATSSRVIQALGFKQASYQSKPWVETVIWPATGERVTQTWCDIAAAGLEHESIRFAHNLSCGSSLSILQERKG